MRLIDADALIKSCQDEKGLYFSYEAAVSANTVDYAPTVDAVPVVRCKYCNMCKIVEYYGGGEKLVCRLFDRSMLPDDFCSYGERKGGDE